MKRLGELIGSGAEKACYEVQRRPDLVALVSLSRGAGYRKDVRQELAWLNAFRKAGIPALKGKYASVLLGDKKVPALLVKRYDFHSFHVVGYEKWLTPRHRKNLKRIAKAFEKAKLETADSQFLFSKRGEVVLADCHEPFPQLSPHNYSAMTARSISKW